MAEKLKNILELAQTLTAGLGDDPDSWKRFLECASRLYKYPFHDQVLIYGQRPDATACAILVDNSLELIGSISTVIPVDSRSCL